VRLWANGTFTKTGGGTIYGYTGDSKSNVVKNRYGVVYNDRGHAVYVDIYYFRDTTAGPEVNLDSRVSGAAGGWQSIY